MGDAPEPFQYNQLKHRLDHADELIRTLFRNPSGGGGASLGAWWFSLADYATETDPVAACLAAAETYWTDNATANGWSYEQGVTIYVPPGEWGTAGTAYNVAFPVHLWGGAEVAHAIMPRASIAGDFTFQVGATMSDLALFGCHVTSNDLRATRCAFAEAPAFATRGGSTPLFTGTADDVSNVLFDRCLVWSVSARRVYDTTAMSSGYDFVVRNCWMISLGGFFRIVGSCRSVKVTDSYLFNDGGSNFPVVDFKGSCLLTEISGNEISGGTCLDFKEAVNSGVQAVWRGESFYIERNVRRSGYTGNRFVSIDYTSFPGSLGGSTPSKGPCLVRFAGNNLKHGSSETGKDSSLYVSMNGPPSGSGGDNGPVTITVADNNLMTNPTGVAVQVFSATQVAHATFTMTGNYVPSVTAGMAPVQLSNVGVVFVNRNRFITLFGWQAVSASGVARAVVSENMISGGSVSLTPVGLSINNV